MDESLVAGSCLSANLGTTAWLFSRLFFWPALRLDEAADADQLLTGAAGGGGTVRGRGVVRRVRAHVLQSRQGGGGAHRAVTTTYQELLVPPVLFAGQDCSPSGRGPGY
jgi:hypothetical protein